MSRTGGSGGGRSGSGKRKWEEENCYVAAYQLLRVQSSHYHKDQLQFMCADKG